MTAGTQIRKSHSCVILPLLLGLVLQKIIVSAFSHTFQMLYHVVSIWYFPLFVFCFVVFSPTYTSSWTTWPHVVIFAWNDNYYPIFYVLSCHPGGMVGYAGVQEFDYQFHFSWAVTFFIRSLVEMTLQARFGIGDIGSMRSCIIWPPEIYTHPRMAILKHPKKGSIYAQNVFSFLKPHLEWCRFLDS